MEDVSKTDFSVHTLDGLLHLNKVDFDQLKLLEKFYEFSPDLLCIATFDGKFKYVNPAVSTTLEYEQHELIGSEIMSFVHPDDRIATIEHRNGIIKGSTLINFENRYISKNGKIIWLSWTSIPDEKLGYVFAIAKDVSAKKLLEQERNQLYQKMVQVNKNLAHFTRIASHDLRSPVNNILSLLDLIDVSKIRDKDMEEIFDLIKTSTQNVARTLEKYIDELNKKDEVFQTEINLKELFNAVCLSISLLIKKTETKIEVDFSAYETLKFNPAYLESIILNLLTNAIKYSHPSRKPLIKFKTRLDEQSKKQLFIEDNGIGIDLKIYKNRIFGLNQTFHQHPDSHGFGLFLVKSHLEELGGKIEVESEVEKGTTFIISFSD